MRFIIMHKTNAHWESGAIPSPELIARVGALIGEMANGGRSSLGEKVSAPAPKACGSGSPAARAP